MLFISNSYINFKVWKLFSPHWLSGGQQNDSSRGIITSEKPLQLAEPLNSQHKIKKLRLDDALSGGLIIFPIRKHTHNWSTRVWFFGRWSKCVLFCLIPKCLREYPRYGWARSDHRLPPVAGQCHWEDPPDHALPEQWYGPVLFNLEPLSVLQGLCDAKATTGLI